MYPQNIYQNIASETTCWPLLLRRTRRTARVQLPPQFHPRNSQEKLVPKRRERSYTLPNLGDVDGIFLTAGWMKKLLFHPIFSKSF